MIEMSWELLPAVFLFLIFVQISAGYVYGKYEERTGNDPLGVVDDE